MCGHCLIYALFGISIDIHLIFATFDYLYGSTSWSFGGGTFLTYTSENEFTKGLCLQSLLDSLISYINSQISTCLLRLFLLSANERDYKHKYAPTETRCASHTPNSSHSASYGARRRNDTIPIARKACLMLDTIIEEITNEDRQIPSTR